LKKCEPDDMLIQFAFLNKCEPDGVPSGCLFQIKMITGWNPSSCQTLRSKNSSFVVDSPPNTKLTTLINNTTHKLLINIKKLLTYDLFGGLIEDLGEMNETDDLLLPHTQLQIQIYPDPWF